MLKVLAVLGCFVLVVKGFSSGQAVLYTALCERFFPSPKTLVKTLAKNPVKNLAKNLDKIWLKMDRKQCE